MSRRAEREGITGWGYECPSKARPFERGEHVLSAQDPLLHVDASFRTYECGALARLFAQRLPYRATDRDAGVRIVASEGDAVDVERDQSCGNPAAMRRSEEGTRSSLLAAPKQPDTTGARRG